MPAADRPRRPITVWALLVLLCPPGPGRTRRRALAHDRADGSIDEHRV